MESFLNSFTTESLVANDFFMGIFLASLILGAYHFFKQLLPKIFNWIITRFSTTVTIHSSDQYYKFFQEWLQQNSFDYFIKNYRINTLETKNNNEKRISEDTWSSG